MEKFSSIKSINAPVAYPSSVVKKGESRIPAGFTAEEYELAYGYEHYRPAAIAAILEGFPCRFDDYNDYIFDDGDPREAAGGIGHNPNGGFYHDYLRSGEKQTNTPSANRIRLTLMRALEGTVQTDEIVSLLAKFTDDDLVQLIVNDETGADDREALLFRIEALRAATVAKFHAERKKAVESSEVVKSQVAKGNPQTAPKVKLQQQQSGKRGKKWKGKKGYKPQPTPTFNARPPQMR